MLPAWFVRRLDEGDEGDDVLIVQRKLGVPMTGVMDLTTMARVRGLQRSHGMYQSGAVGPQTAAVLGEKASAGRPPEWFHRTIGMHDSGPDVDALALALGVSAPGWFTPDLTTAVRRFQASAAIPTTGVLDDRTAVALADRTA